MSSKKIGVLVYDKEGAQRNQGFITFLVKAFAGVGIVLKCVIVEESSLEQILDNKPEFAIVRTMNEALSKALEQNGIRVFNPSIVSHICNHKGRTYQMVEDAGIPILKTWNHYDAWRLAGSHLPVVIKPAMGHGGIGVTKAETREAVADAVRMMESYPGGDYVIQEMASNPGKDLRVYCMGGKVIGQMLRTSETDFRSNFCLGGSASVYDMNEDERDLLERVLALLPFDYVGIDFMFHEGHLIFNEIEDVVGARMLYNQGVDVAALYAAYIDACMYGKAFI